MESQSSVVIKWEKAQKLVTNEKQIRLTRDDTHFHVSDWLPNKPLEIIYSTLDINDLLIWIEGYLAASRIFKNLYPQIK